jgi:hypothetical protein
LVSQDKAQENRHGISVRLDIMRGRSMRAMSLGCVLSIAAWACAESEENPGSAATGGSGGTTTGGSGGTTTGGSGGATGGNAGSGGTAGVAGASSGGTAGSSTGGQSGGAGTDGGPSDGGSCPVGASLDGAGCSGITGNLSAGAEPCVFALPGGPGGANVDPNKVNLSIVNPTGIEFLGNVCTEPDCATHTNGWYFDDNGTPTEVHLCPDACQLLGQTSQLIMTLGCPTIAASP